MNTLNFEIKSIDNIINASDLTKEGSLVEQIYSILRKKIINLSLLSETPLVEKEIAAIFEISKTPVREALIRLANDELVKIMPQSGSFVAPISLERYFEACFIRGKLEGGCVARLAEKGITLSEQVQLQSIITKQEQLLKEISIAESEHDNARLIEINETFHRSLFEYAGLLGAWRLLDNSKAAMSRVKHLKRLLGIKHKETVIEEHTRIVEAIIKRDPKAAEAAMIKHIGDVDTEMAIISQNPQFIQSMNEFNMLVNEQRNRQNASKYNAKRFVSKRMVF
jgi:DNA-binding GntR family transcriptional regulator